ncbi:hypothetical protein HDU91_006350 [Kappamyces sp. JEL0680]|nr:hypothetical protein HDU91_006350 [Kappamyces sp. JEL0680]
MKRQVERAVKLSNLQLEKEFLFKSIFSIFSEFYFKLQRAKSTGEINKKLLEILGDFQCFLGGKQFIEEWCAVLEELEHVLGVSLGKTLSRHHSNVSRRILSHPSKLLQDLATLKDSFRPLYFTFFDMCKLAHQALLEMQFDLESKKEFLPTIDALNNVLDRVRKLLVVRIKSSSSLGLLTTLDLERDVLHRLKALLEMYYREFPDTALSVYRRSESFSSVHSPSFEGSRVASEQESVQQIRKSLSLDSALGNLPALDAGEIESIVRENTLNSAKEADSTGMAADDSARRVQTAKSTRFSSSVQAIHMGTIPGARKRIWNKYWPDHDDVAVSAGVISPPATPEIRKKNLKNLVGDGHLVNPRLLNSDHQCQSPVAFTHSPSMNLESLQGHTPPEDAGTTTVSEENIPLGMLVGLPAADNAADADGVFSDNEVMERELLPARAPLWSVASRPKKTFRNFISGAFGRRLRPSASQEYLQHYTREHTQTLLEPRLPAVVNEAVAGPATDSIMPISRSSQSDQFSYTSSRKGSVSDTSDAADHESRHRTSNEDGVHWPSVIKAATEINGTETEHRNDTQGETVSAGVDSNVITAIPSFDRPTVPILRFETMVSHPITESADSTMSMSIQQSRSVQALATENSSWQESSHALVLDAKPSNDTAQIAGVGSKNAVVRLSSGKRDFMCQTDINIGTSVEFSQDISVLNHEINILHQQNSELHIYIQQLKAVQEEAIEKASRAPMLENSSLLEKITTLETTIQHQDETIIELYKTLKDLAHHREASSLDRSAPDVSALASGVDKADFMCQTDSNEHESSEKIDALGQEIILLQHRNTELTVMVEQWKLEQEKQLEQSKYPSESELLIEKITQLERTIKHQDEIIAELYGFINDRNDTIHCGMNADKPRKLETSAVTTHIGYEPWYQISQMDLINAWLLGTLLVEKAFYSASQYEYEAVLEESFDSDSTVREIAAEPNPDSEFLPKLLLTQSDLSTAWLLGTIGVLSAPVEASIASHSPSAMSANEIAISTRNLIFESTRPFFEPVSRSAEQARETPLYSQQDLVVAWLMGSVGVEAARLPTAEEELLMEQVQQFISLMSGSDSADAVAESTSRDMVVEDKSAAFHQSDVIAAWLQASVGIESVAGRKPATASVASGADRPQLAIHTAKPVDIPSLAVHLEQHDLVVAWLQGSVGVTSLLQPHPSRMEPADVSNDVKTKAVSQKRAIVGPDSSVGVAVHAAEHWFQLSQTDIVCAWLQASLGIRPESVKTTDGATATEPPRLEQSQTVTLDFDPVDSSQQDLVVAWLQASLGIRPDSVKTTDGATATEPPRLEQSQTVTLDFDPVDSSQQDLVVAWLQASLGIHAIDVNSAHKRTEEQLSHTTNAAATAVSTPWPLGSSQTVQSDLVAHWLLGSIGVIHSQQSHSIAHTSLRESQLTTRFNYGTTNGAAATTSYHSFFKKESHRWALQQIDLELAWLQASLMIHQNRGSLADVDGSGNLQDNCSSTEMPTVHHVSCATLPVSVQDIAVATACPVTEGHSRDIGVATEVVYSDACSETIPITTRSVETETDMVTVDATKVVTSTESFNVDGAATAEYIGATVRSETSSGETSRAWGERSAKASASALTEHWSEENTQSQQFTSEVVGVAVSQEADVFSTVVSREVTLDSEPHVEPVQAAESVARQTLEAMTTQVPDSFISSEDWAIEIHSTDSQLRTVHFWIEFQTQLSVSCHVTVRCSLDGWEHDFIMLQSPADPRRYDLDLQAPDDADNKVEFKFMVWEHGVLSFWLCNSELPTCHDPMGNINNYLYLEDDSNLSVMDSEQTNDRHNVDGAATAEYIGATVRSETSSGETSRAWGERSAKASASALTEHWSEENTQSQQFTSEVVGVAVSQEADVFSTVVSREVTLDSEPHVEPVQAAESVARQTLEAMTTQVPDSFISSEDWAIEIHSTDSQLRTVHFWIEFQTQLSVSCHVTVRCSLDGWEHDFIMLQSPADPRRYDLDLQAPDDADNKVEFKFMVWEHGVLSFWLCNSELPTCHDPMGNINNYLYLENTDSVEMVRERSSLSYHDALSGVLSEDTTSFVTAEEFASDDTEEIASAEIEIAVGEMGNTQDKTYSSVVAGSLTKTTEPSLPSTSLSLNAEAAPVALDTTLASSALLVDTDMPILAANPPATTAKMSYASVVSNNTGLSLNQSDTTTMLQISVGKQELQSPSIASDTTVDHVQHSAVDTQAASDNDELDTPTDSSAVMMAASKSIQGSDASASTATLQNSVQESQAVKALVSEVEQRSSRTTSVSTAATTSRLGFVQQRIQRIETSKGSNYHDSLFDSSFLEGAADNVQVVVLDGSEEMEMKAVQRRQPTQPEKKPTGFIDYAKSFLF